MRISDWSSDVCSSDLAALRAATQAQKRALIAAHPDLAGRLVRAGRLTTVSAKEQASAGLDLLTDAERARFTALNEAYQAQFGLPFVMAVKGRSKAEILAALARRLGNSPAREFAPALGRLEQTALLSPNETLT